MIKKIDFRNNNYPYNNVFISLNLTNQEIIRIQNDKILKRNKINSTEKINSLISNFIPFWNYEYINNSIIDGNETAITIYTEEETINYHFKNKFPSNYDEFITLFKEIIDEE